jgi:hypothetical protein
MAHRHRTLFDLIGLCQRWVRSLPPDAPIDVAPFAPATPQPGDLIETPSAAARRERHRRAAEGEETEGSARAAHEQPTQASEAAE